VRNVEIKVEVPEEILLTTRFSKEDMAEEFKKVTAMELYKEGKLSLGKSAKLADLCISDFIDFLGTHKVSIFDYTKEELEKELS
jgi:predicted HTH domain antitoxin